MSTPVPNSEAITVDERRWLQELAKKASSGPWIVSCGEWISDNGGEDGGDLSQVVCEQPEEGRDRSRANWPDNAAFIAAANPETVLRLLSALDALEFECQHSLEVVAESYARAEAAEAKLVALQTRGDALAEAVRKASLHFVQVGTELPDFSPWRAVIRELTSWTFSTTEAERVGERVVTKAEQEDE